MSVAPPAGYGTISVIGPVGKLAASPAAVDPRRYSRFADFMKQSGLIATSLPVETYIGSR